MHMKRLILCFILIFLTAWPLLAQEEEEIPEEDVEQEEPVEEEAAPTGGGGGVSDLLFGAGALYTLSIGGTDHTDSAEGASFFPRGTIFFGLDAFGLEGELLLTTFTVKSSAGLSSSKLADAELIFKGQTYTIFTKFGEELAFYAGYGINDFSISHSSSSKTSTAATSAGVTFNQDLKAQPGTQIIVGTEFNLGDVVITGDFRLLMVPATLTTEITPFGTSTTTTTETALDFNFTILTVGTAYNF